MEIKNEEHAEQMVLEWRDKPVPAQIREIRLAIEKLELSCMYFEQKDNEKGVTRCQRCIKVLAEYLREIE